MSATSTVCDHGTSGVGSRSKSTKSGRSGLSMREYQAFMSMQPMLTIQRTASSSSTTGKSTHFFAPPSRVETCARYVGIHSGMCLGASFWKNALP